MLKSVISGSCPTLSRIYQRGVGIHTFTNRSSSSYILSSSPSSFIYQRQYSTHVNDPKGHKKSRDQLISERNEAMDLVGNKTIEGIEKDIKESESKLKDSKSQRKRLEEKEAKTKKDILVVLALAAVASVVFIRDYMIRQEKKKQFDEEWESLRVLVNKRDELNLKKKDIVTLITSYVLKENPSLSNPEEINKHVDTILTTILSTNDIKSTIDQSISNIISPVSSAAVIGSSSPSSINPPPQRSGRI